MSSSRFALHGRALGQLPAALVAAVAGLPHVVVEGPALLVDDVAQLLGDVVVHATEVVLLQEVGAPAAQLLHELAQALQALAVAVPEPALHHAAAARC